MFAGGARDRPVHCLEIRHPEQPGDAWGYQRLGDGADNRLSSSSARSSSMRAPAAADAASHASCVSVDDTAFRLTVAARFAIWNAARNSPCAASSSAGGRMTASICPPITRCCSMRGSSSRDGPERSRIWTSSFLASRSSCDRPLDRVPVHAECSETQRPMRHAPRERAQPPPAAIRARPAEPTYSAAVSGRGDRLPGARVRQGPARRGDRHSLPAYSQPRESRRKARRMPSRCATRRRARPLRAPRAPRPSPSAVQCRVPVRFRAGARRARQDQE